MYAATFFGLFPAFPLNWRAFVAMSFDKRVDARWDIDASLRELNSRRNLTMRRAADGLDFDSWHILLETNASKGGATGFQAERGTSS